MTVERLKAAGGDVVVSEAYASSSGIREVIADVGAPKLALNGTVRLYCSFERLWDDVRTRAVLAAFAASCSSSHVPHMSDQYTFRVDFS